MTEEAQTDHDLILMLKNKIEHLEEEVKETENNLNESLSEHHETAEQLAFHEKLEAQASLLRSVFYGVIFLVMMMGILVIVGWATAQSTIEREMAFFERIILVFIGIVGGAVSSFFDIRNFSVSESKNGNKKRSVADTD